MQYQWSEFIKNFYGLRMRLTWDLHQRINISATILKSSLESESGSFSHLDLQYQRNFNLQSVHFLHCKISAVSVS